MKLLSILRNHGLAVMLLLAMTPALNAQTSASAPGSMNSPSAGFSQDPSAGSGQSEKSYVIGPTNLLFIKVLGENGLQQTYRVDESGFITHPLIGRMKIGGKTVAQAEEVMRKALAGDYILDPNVTIFVMEHSRYSVLGEVRKPGNYEILGRLSLVEGISIAGGFTPLANEKKVRILRRDENGEQTILVNVRDLIEGKKESIDIQAGDIIEVPKSFF
jgi:polysaccharide biosynthesis/export protein